MLTTTCTIEKPLTPTEKIALDNQKVCEAFIQAYEAGDRQTACEYAKVIFLKALSLWGFQRFSTTCGNCGKLKILKSQKSYFFGFLSFSEILKFKFFKILSFFAFFRFNF